MAAALVIGIGAVAVYQHNKHQSPSTDLTPAVTTSPAQKTQPNNESVVSKELTDNPQPLAQVESPSDDSIQGHP